MFDVSSCVGSSAWCRTTSAETFSLRLDGELHGVAEMEPASGRPIALDVVQSAADGVTMLKGVSTVPAQPRMDLEIQLEGLAPGNLTGGVRYTISGVPSGWSTSSAATRTGPILFMRQVTTVRAGALQGTWRGYLQRTACSGDCKDSAASQELTLWIAQQGQQLTAFLNRTQIEGTTSGQEFTFTSNLNKADCRPVYDMVNPCTDDIVFNGSVDDLDRMRGTIQRRQTGINYHTGRYSWTATFELSSVARLR